MLTYNMQMPVQTIWAHPSARELQGKVAMQRGPLVYCLEGTDHQGIPLDYIALDPKQISAGNFQAEHLDNLLEGVTILRGTASVMNENEWTGRLYQHSSPALHSVELTAIPYYAWGNREPGEMRVWLQSTRM